MTAKRLSEELKETITTGLSLRQTILALREYKRLEVTREEVQRALETLRQERNADVAEDRIVEVMDVVSGFCSRENSVWEE